SRNNGRGTISAGLRRARTLGQVATTCEEPSGQVHVVLGKLIKSLRRARNRRGRFTSCEETWSSRYDMRGTVEAGLRRARTLGQVSTLCEEPLGQVYVQRGHFVKSLRRARNRHGRFTSCEESWSSRYDVRVTVGAGLRHARTLGQVSTLCEETLGQVYVLRGHLVKSLRRARNRRGRFTSCEESWSSRYDVRGTVGAGLRRAKTLGQVATTCLCLARKVDQSLRCARNRQCMFTSCEETWSSRYDVRETVRAGLRHARTLGQVATTCEEPSGHVYVVRGTLVKSLRRVRNRWGRFRSCDETWLSRYDVRGTVGAGLRRARKLGQVATTCEEPSGQVYVVRGNLVKSLRRARNRRGTFTSCEETWSSRYDVRGNVGAGLRRARKLGQVATTCEEPSGQVYDVRVTLVKSLRRARNRRGRILGWSTTGLGTMRNLESDSQLPTLSGTKGKTTFLTTVENPAHVSLWWVNKPTLGEFCFTMIGRADIEDQKATSKGSLGHAFTVSYCTGNQNQTSFYPSESTRDSVHVELTRTPGVIFNRCGQPQQNPHLTNVFRPDRPAEASLVPWKRGAVPPSDSRISVGLESSSTGSSFPADSAKPVPLAGVSLDSRQGHRIPLVRTSSELAVRRPGKAPERAVPSPSPGRHAATRSRRVSSSSSPPTADGFETGTPVPSPQSQSFSRGYGSILPTSLAYIVPSTRGCSPWRPDAVMSTTGRGRHSVLPDFQGPPGAHRTPRDVRLLFQPLDPTSD
ncbi:hypothetical protein Tco_0648167, partial [Tanacetum coccineum]